MTKFIAFTVPVCYILAQTPTNGLETDYFSQWHTSKRAINEEMHQSHARWQENQSGGAKYLKARILTVNTHKG